MLFQWLFIPWLQAELERYQYCINNSLKRRDRNKVSAASAGILEGTAYSLSIDRFCLMACLN